MSWGIDFPYADKKNYVFTTKQGLKNTDNTSFISENHVDFVYNLKDETGLDIWLLGGGQPNTMFLNEKLIDEIYVYIMPIVFSGGINLFEAIPIETKLKLIELKS